MWTKIKDDPLGAGMMAWAAILYALGFVGFVWIMWLGFSDLFNGQVPPAVRHAGALSPLALLIGLTIGFLAGQAYGGWASRDK
jgi:hypothetical protein